MNNINNHISDQASTSKFDPTGTQWGADVKDVQTALSKIGKWATVDEASHNATETQKGIARIATQEEITTGDDDSTIVTPKKLSVRLSSPMADENVKGWAIYSTNDISMDKGVSSSAITPKNLHHVMDTRKASETVVGTTQLSSQAAAVAGVDNTTSMSPLRVKQAIGALVPKTATATESVQGTSQLATVAQALAGQIREGYSVSPYTFRKAVDQLMRKIIVNFSGSEGEIQRGWALCDGRTVNGIRTPDLRNRFVMGGHPTQNGQIGGSHTHNAARGLWVNGHALTHAQIPSHAHSRGSMNITGNIYQDDTCSYHANGAFYRAQHFGYDARSKGGGDGGRIQFDAARTWSGVTSYVGSNQAHSHGISGNNQDYRPAYYTLAYIMYVGI